MAKVGDIRKNKKTGRLERLVGSKEKGTLRWKPQNEMGAWKKGSPIRKLGRLLIREPSPKELAEAKRVREKKGKEKAAKKESDRKKLFGLQVNLLQMNMVSTMSIVLN